MKTSIKDLRFLALLVSFVVTTVSFAQQQPQLTDPEIASVAVVANQIDINYADIALKKSSSKEVKEFATRMKKDHSTVIDQAVALVQKLGVTPKDNAVSQSLMASAEKTKSVLNAKPAKEFDKAYIDNEVSYHKAVIATVRGTLIPQAKNAELKNLLETVLPVLETHLGHAEMVQHNFSK